MIALRAFSGMLPKVPGHLLPETAAGDALNCNFAFGELRGFQDRSLLQAFATPVRSLWTETGLTFLTWDTDVDVVRGPVVSDQFQRLYYSQASGMRVTQRSQATINGGQPVSQWKVGVPAPTTAPQVQIVELEELPLDTKLEWKFWFEANGIKYQSAEITPTEESRGRRYSITIPARIGGTEEEPATPDNAVPVLEVRGIRTVGNPPNDTQTFRAISTNSSFTTDSETTNFNGATLEISIDNDKATVEFKYGKGFDQTRAFVFTQVNLFGEEGAPSPPVVVTYDLMQSVSISLPAAPPTSQGWVPITGCRVYGTVSSSSGLADYQLIGESPGNIGRQFKVATKPEEWGRALNTINYFPPPDGLIGITAMPNGIIAGFRGTEIWFSESYKPWAFNPENVITLQYGIIGIKLNGSALVVITSAFPYIVQGATPDAMMERKLGQQQAGLSKRGMCDCGSFIAYLSNDGIVLVENGQASLTMSQRFFTRFDWRGLYGALFSKMELAFFDGTLYCFTDTGVGFSIRFDEAEAQFSRIDTPVTANFVLPLTDSLYVAQGNSLFIFGNAASFRPFSWTSREYILPTPMNYGALQTIGFGQYKVEVLVDGQVRYSADVMGNHTTKLPSGFKSRKWRVRLSSQSTGSVFVREVYLAPTLGALRNV
jgi:hypothetical protein